MGRPRTYATLLERIEANCVKIPWTGCWIWMGSISCNYAKITTRRPKAKKTRTRLAHREAYQEYYEKTLRSSVEVRHTCNVSICCNPLHMCEGSRLDNVHDTIKAGNHSFMRTCSWRCYWCRKEKELRLNEQRREYFNRLAGA